MIDSGGAEDLEKYDVGKKVLIPYLLTKGIKQLDYILISHFHADHCNGFLAIMKELEVGTLLIAKPKKMTEEVKEILSVAKQKQIKIVYVTQGQMIQIDKETMLEILYIGKDNQNLNNNSIIARVRNGTFSILFTGDAEVEEEAAFLKQYEKQNIQADILKIGHHRVGYIKYRRAFRGS